MKIAVLGSGVAGLSAARELQSRGISVKLFDKSRGVGGRMSTRYAGDWEFDHGAQYFTAQDPDFKAEIDAAVAAGVAARWPATGLYLSGGEVSADTGRGRYVGQPRMNSLPKYWAQSLDVHLGRRVAKVEKNKVKKPTGWDISFEDGSRESGFDGVISTLPPAQAKEVLPRCFTRMTAVKSAEMHACFCLMVGLGAPMDLKWESLRVKNLPIDWIAVNHAKPGRSKTLGSLVVHSEAAWSDKHADADRDWVQNIMLETTSSLMGVDLFDAPHIALHRWLYASSKSSPEQYCLAGEGIVAAGDWCLGGRVQGAWLSGRAAAREILSRQNA